MSAGYIFDMAQDILDAATDAIAHDRTGHQLPGRINISWDVPPADDCCNGQLTVHLGGVDPLVTHLEGQPCVRIPQAHWTITLLRCVPVSDDQGAAPTTDALTASAEGIMVDLWALLTGLYNAIEDGTLYSGVSCDNITIDEVSSLATEGGCGGFTVGIITGLNDSGPVTIS